MKHKQFLNFSLLFLLLLACSLFYVLPAQAEEEMFEKTYALQAEGKVSLSNLQGNIEVKSWKENSVKVEARKVGKDKADLQKVKIDVQASETAVRIKTDYESGRSSHTNVSVHYKLWIPEKAVLDIETVSGDISLMEIGGKSKIEAVSGDIKLTGITAAVNCQTVSGDINGSSLTGEVEIESVSGDVSLDTVNGSIDVESVSGDVNLKNVAGAKEIDVESVSGDIHYFGEINETSTYSFSSHSGDVEINFPIASDFEIVASTFSGEISSDFELVMQGSMKKNKLSGKAGKGGAELKCSSFSGDIKVKKQ